METPDWNRFDTIKSIRDLGSLALDTLANTIKIDFDVRETEEEA